MTEHLLTNDLVAYFDNKQLPERYCAVLQCAEDKEPIVKVLQPIGGEWYATGGSWYLSTLMQNPKDGIAIDFGQKWEIRKGFLNAIRKAGQIVGMTKEQQRALILEQLEENLRKRPLTVRGGSNPHDGKLVPA